MRGLEQKRIIVTGSGRGIGRAIARRLAKEGATVVVNDIDADNAQETVDLIRDAGGSAIAARADVTDLDDVRQMVSTAIGEIGSIDVLVNNAGWDQIE